MEDIAEFIRSDTEQSCKVKQETPSDHIGMQMNQVWFVVIAT